MKANDRFECQQVNNDLVFRCRVRWCVWCGSTVVFLNGSLFGHRVDRDRSCTILDPLSEQQLR